MARVRGKLDLAMLCYYDYVRHSFLAENNLYAIFLQSTNEKYQSRWLITTTVNAFNITVFVVDIKDLLGLFWEWGYVSVIVVVGRICPIMSSYKPKTN